MNCKYKVKIKRIQYNYRVQMAQLQGKYKFNIFCTGGNKELEEKVNTLYEAWPRVSGTGETITLDNTVAGKMLLDLKGNTSQEGTPTPTTPIPVNVVSGDNEIQVCGENLFDKDNANYVNGWIDDTTMRLNTINGNRMFYIPCKPNTTYTISRSIITSSFRTTTYDSTPFPTVTSSNVNYTVPTVIQNNSGTTLTITTNANAKYLVVHYGKIEDTNLNETLATIMVVKGNTAPTTYEPYKGASYPIALPEGMFLGWIPNTDYRDIIFQAKTGDTYYDSLDSTTKESLTYGKWYVNKQIGKVVLNGSESWGSASSIASGTSRFYYRNDKVFNGKIDSDPSIYVVSYSFKGMSWQNIYYDNRTIKNAIANYNSSSVVEGRITIRIDNTIANDVSTFKTWLSTHNTVVYYVLATPTYTEITDSTLLSQLEAIKEAESYSGQTNISQTNDDKPFILTATALRDLSNL